MEQEGGPASLSSDSTEVSRPSFRLWKEDLDLYLPSVSEALV